MKKVMFILLGFILGIIGTSYVAYKLMASQVSFDKSKTDLNSNDVQGAIDELANMFETNKIKLIKEYSGTGFYSFNHTFENDYPKIYVIFSGTRSTGSGVYPSISFSLSQNDYEAISSKLNSYTHGDDSVWNQIDIYSLNNVKQGDTIKFYNEQGKLCGGILQIYSTV